MPSRRAWNVALSLPSAWPPGTDEAIVGRDDDGRAAAVLGPLVLVPLGDEPTAG